MLIRFLSGLALLTVALNAAPAALSPLEQGIAPKSTLPEALPGVPRSAQITPFLYRGGQPTREGLESLKKAGIKTIISVRHPQEISSEMQPVEEAFARANGIQFKRVPMLGVPSLQQVQEVFALIENSPQPVLVHCLNGSERSSVMIGFYRMRREGWNVTQVLQEAEKYNISFRGDAYKNFLETLNTVATRARAADKAAPAPAPAR